MEELGIWNFIHGTGAGCASIVAWEGSRIFVHGHIAILVYGAATVIIMHVVHRHRVQLIKKAKEESKDPPAVSQEAK